MTSEHGPISTTARRALEQELTELHTERETVAAARHDPDTVGDRADEADELQRATELEHLDARIREIDLRLREAAAAGRPRSDAVGVGSTVRVRFSDGTAETLHVDTVAEEPEQALVTTDSPLGRALLGHRTGDTVYYDTPEGRASAVVMSLGGGPGG